MKVLVIHNRYRFTSGQDVMYEAIVRLLRHKGHIVLLFERSSRNIINLEGKIRAFTEGIYSRSAKKAVSSILASERPDVVHVNNLEPLISPSVLVACQQFGVPVVMRCPHYHLTCPIGLHLRNGAVCELCCGGREYWCVLKNCRGNIFESVGYALRSTVARKQRLFLDNVTYYLPPTIFAKRRLSDAGFPQKRIIVLQNMVCVPNSGVDAFYGKYVAYAGRFSPEKGIQTLLTSARQIGLPVRLAGDYLSLPEVLKAAPPNVQFTGHLNQNRLVEFYRNARFVVIPSICFDVSPLTAAEAMSHGLPVIASRIGGIPELVEDGVTGFLFEPGNTEDLVEKMKLLWENPNLCRKMGKAGRDKSIKEYSADVYYERLMTVYDRAIEIVKEQQS